MFERYTPGTRKVIFFARYEASRLGSPELAIDHLWLGLLRENKRLLHRLAPHITPEFLASRLPPQPDADAPRVSMTTDLPLSPAVKRALFLAAGPDESSNSPIKVDDIILALLREDQPPTP